MKTIITLLLLVSALPAWAGLDKVNFAAIAAVEAPAVPAPAACGCAVGALALIRLAAAEVDPLDPARAMPAAKKIEAAARACPETAVKLAAVAALRRGLTADRFEPTATMALALGYICGDDRACAVAAIEAQGWLITPAVSPLAVEWSVYNIWTKARYPEVKAAAEAALKWVHPL